MSTIVILMTFFTAGKLRAEEALPKPHSSVQVGKNCYIC